MWTGKNKKRKRPRYMEAAGGKPAAVLTGNQTEDAQEKKAKLAFRLIEKKNTQYFFCVMQDVAAKNAKLPKK